MRPHLPLAWMAAALLLAPSAARAGALGKVIGGLERASGQKYDSSSGSGSGGSGGSSGANKSDSSDSGSSDSDGGADWSWGSSSPRRAPNENWVLGSGYVAPPAGGPEADVALYLGFQSVDDSDGALSLELRASYGEYGVGVTTTSFFEHTGDGGEYFRLDLWSLGGAWRVLGSGPLLLWVDGGLGGLAAGDMSLFGAQAGVRLERKLGGELAAGVEGRLFWMQDNVFADEALLSLRASILRVSYRIVDFNVGPPLMGPELGVTVVF